MNVNTDERMAKLAASGKLPLDYLLEVMRDPEVKLKIRLDAAKAAAPFVHPRLSAVELAGKDGGPLKVEVVRFGT